MLHHMKCHHPLNAAEKLSCNLCRISKAEEPSVDEAHSKVNADKEVAFIRKIPTVTEDCMKVFENFSDILGGTFTYIIHITSCTKY